MWITFGLRVEIISPFHFHERNLLSFYPQPPVDNFVIYPHTLWITFYFGLYCLVLLVRPVDNLAVIHRAVHNFDSI
jgi:hypothetical protein